MSTLDLSRVPHLEARRVVADALDKFEQISDREYDAVREIQDEISRIRDTIMREAFNKADAETSELKAKVDAIRASFAPEWDALKGYPDIDSSWRMHDDHLGVDCCAKSGLPLRHDDMTIENEDGDEMLACLAGVQV